MKTLKQLQAMTSRQIANHLVGITQTPICKNKKYCAMVLKVFASKPLTAHEADAIPF